MVEDSSLVLRGTDEDYAGFIVVVHNMVREVPGFSGCLPLLELVSLHPACGSLCYEFHLGLGPLTSDAPLL